MPRPLPRPGAVPLFVLISAFAAGAGSPGSPTLPDGVLRGLLAGDGTPCLFITLDPEMSLAYDELGGSLLLAWKGRPVPDPSPGPAPAGGRKTYRAEGAVYHRRSSRAPWEAIGPKGNQPVTVTFKGISERRSLRVIAWRLGLPGGKSVSVEEVPMFDDHYGDPGVFRNFTVTGLPPGLALRLSLAGRGLPETWGGGGEGGLQGSGDSLSFRQDRDGETPLKVTWSPASGAAP